MHSETQFADTVISRSVYNRETTVDNLEYDGSCSRMGLRASLGVGVLGFERPHGRPLQCVSSSKWHMSAYHQMKKFKPLSRHNVVFSVAIAAILSFIKIYTTYTTLNRTSNRTWCPHSEGHTV
jgi:hypothetical protein